MDRISFADERRELVDIVGGKYPPLTQVGRVHFLTVKKGFFLLVLGFGLLDFLGVWSFGVWYSLIYLYVCVCLCV